jgi:surface antigen Omp85-like protein
MGRGATALVVFTIGTVPTMLGGQNTSVTVAAGPGYGAGWLHRWLLGSHYRTLWTTPITVRELDLARFAGGLTPLRCAGQRQTKSLRFSGADGREYVFRSVDKDPTLAMPPDLRETFARDLLQDQISSAHPGGPLVVAPLLQAAGVLNAEPQLFALPDDPRVTRFACMQAGMLGMIEERPTEGTDSGPGFGGAADLATTTKLFDLLEQHPEHRVDSRGFLAARLLDVFLGDWDRHQLQWRWARFDAGGAHRWRPIPRDRDQAFSRLDGLLLALAGFYQPQVVGFGDDYPSIYRLTLTGQVLDRRLLTDLEQPAWDSTAAALRARLTDSVIDAAVHRLPPEYERMSGAALIRALRRRRDRLPEIADRYYRLLARVVELHATDQPDTARIERRADGLLNLRLTAQGITYFDRTFDSHDTREIRLYLHGGDDRLLVVGHRDGGPLLRVIGGGGDDLLADSAGHARLYDDRGNNRLVRGPGTSVDSRPFTTPDRDTLTLGLPRDWGARSVPLTTVSYVPDIGLFVGAGVSRTGYGFRHLPNHTKLTLRAGWATAAASYRAEIVDSVRGVLGGATGTLHLRGSGIEVVRYYGVGNETVASQPDAFYKVRQEQFLLEPSLTVPSSGTAQLSFGPVFKHAEADRTSGTIFGVTPIYGASSFSQLGAEIGVHFDTRDAPRAASRGLVLTLRGVWYPAVFDVVKPFGSVSGEASTYLSARIPTEPTLALRVGGKRVWGPFPFQEAAFVGGAATVRGFKEHRFAGDAAVYGNAELRFRLLRFHFLTPVDFGLFGLADVGRVYLRGETSTTWHSATGGGVWFAFIKRSNTISIAAARSVERTGIYVRAGFAF